MSPRSRSKLDRQRRRRLGLEQLDARICLAADAVFDAGVLTITGSREADNVSIHDNGRGVIIVADGDSRDRTEFRGVQRIVVDTGAGDDTIRVIRRGGSEPTVPEWDITAGEGDDDVTIGLLLPAVQKVREAAARMHVDLGDGHDRLQVRTTGIDQVDLNVTAGEGDDDVAIGLLLPAVQKVREAAATSAAVVVDLGGGNDRLRLNGHGMSEADLDISAGEGDDDVAIGLLLPAVQKVREAAARVHVDLGGGNDRLLLSTTGVSQLDLDITAGEGDDAILIGLLLPAVQKVRESAALLDVDLGAGADTLHVRQQGFATFETNVVSDEDDIVVLPGGPGPGGRR